MHVAEWSKSEVEYGRRVLNSGLEGVRSGQEAFLHGRPVTPVFRGSLCNAWKPAALGACIGILTGCRKDHHRSLARIMTSGLFGGLVGLAAGVVWGPPLLCARAARGGLSPDEKGTG